MRDHLHNSQFFDNTVEFISKYDDLSFDANTPILDITMLKPLLKKVLKNPKDTTYEKV